MAKFENRLPQEDRDRHVRYMLSVFSRAKQATRFENGERTPGMDAFQIRCGRNGPLNQQFKDFGLTDREAEKIVFQYGMYYTKVFRRPTQEEIDEIMRENERVTEVAAGHQNDTLWLTADYNKKATVALEVREAFWQHEIRHCQGRLTPLILLTDVIKAADDNTRATIVDFMELRNLQRDRVLIIPVRSDGPDTGIWTNKRNSEDVVVDAPKESFETEDSPI